MRHKYVLVILMTGLLTSFTVHTERKVSKTETDKFNLLTETNFIGLMEGIFNLSDRIGSSGAGNEFVKYTEGRLSTTEVEAMCIKLGYESRKDFDKAFFDINLYTKGLIEISKSGNSDVRISKEVFATAVAEYYKAYLNKKGVALVPDCFDLWLAGTSTCNNTYWLMVEGGVDPYNAAGIWAACLQVTNIAYVVCEGAS